MRCPWCSSKACFDKVWDEFFCPSCGWNEFDDGPIYDDETEEDYWNW